MADEPEVRFCPLGRPRQGRPITYAYCSECKCVRKSNRDCPAVLASLRAQAEADA